jgi:hypothetical protein
MPVVVEVDGVVEAALALKLAIPTSTACGGDIALRVEPGAKRFVHSLDAVSVSCACQEAPVLRVGQPTQMKDPNSHVLVLLVTPAVSYRSYVN